MRPTEGTNKFLTALASGLANPFDAAISDWAIEKTARPAKLVTDDATQGVSRTTKELFILTAKSKHVAELLKDHADSWANTLDTPAAQRTETFPVGAHIAPASILKGDDSTSREQAIKDIEKENSWENKITDVE